MGYISGKLYDGRPITINTKTIESIYQKTGGKNTTMRTVSGDEIELLGDVVDQITGQLETQALVCGFPEVQRVVVLSTGHMTEKDDEILRKLEEPGSIEAGNKPSWLDATEFGHRIRVRGCDFPEEFKGMANVLRLSGDLQHVLQTAYERGFDEVLFDCDGPESDEFVVFEW